MLNNFLKYFNTPILLIIIGLLCSYQTNAQINRIAIVIDDMGYRYTDKHALTLPGAITYSFLPHTTYSKSLAIQANKANHDVLLHIPMESENKKTLGPGALTSAMSEQEFNQSLAQSFAEIPFAIGINNHMGSYLTQLERPMAWTMKFLKNNNLFFLDSRTSPHSKAKKIALHYGVAAQKRHVFLDNELTEKYIKAQFRQLIRLAIEHQSAIAIAHPHPETIAMLSKLIPTLTAYNIELVPLSHLYLAAVSRKRP